MKNTDKKQNRIHLIYGIALSVILAVTGILFIWSCYSIYRSGDSPFTRESIGAAFDKIAIPVYITIVAVVGGVVINLIYPREEGKLKGVRAPAVALKKVAEKVNICQLDADLRARIVKERRYRDILNNVNIVLLAISAFYPLIYLLNPNNFPAVSGEYNSEILHGMLVYLVCLAPLAIYEVVYVILSDRSCRREIELCKEAIKTVGAMTHAEEHHDCPICRTVGFFKKNEKPIILGVRIALVGSAIGFIIAGAMNGGMADVLNKAIKICTECIGLG